jgi:hypothetical protein
MNGNGHRSTSIKGNEDDYSKRPRIGLGGKCCIARLWSRRLLIVLMEEAEKRWPHNSSVIALTFGPSTWVGIAVLSSPSTTSPVDGSYVHYGESRVHT